MIAARRPWPESEWRVFRALQFANFTTELQGKAGDSDGAVRYTAPSLLFQTSDGRRAGRHALGDDALWTAARPINGNRLAVAGASGTA